MERINDIFNNIKDRFSSHLFFSFVCSWLIVNWEISIALIWYDTKQVYNEGYLSIFSFIKNKIAILNTIVYPFLLAIFYTFFSPVVKNLIKVFYTKIFKWGENWNLRILDGGKVGIEKYLKLRTNYHSRTKILEEVISQENEFKDLFNQLQDKLYNTETSLNESVLNYNKIDKILSQLKDDRILNGWWELSYQYVKNSKPELENIFIENGKCFRLTFNDEKELIFEIKNFYYDSRNDNIFFIKQTVIKKDFINIPSKNVIYHNINRLKLETEDLLIGEEIRENKNVNIQYKRKK